MPKFLDNIVEQIKSKPALAIGMLVGTGVVVYVIIKTRNQPTTTSGDTSQGNQSDSLNGMDLASIAGIPYGYEFGQIGQNNPPVSNTTTTGDTTTTTTQNVKVRNVGLNPSWDNAHKGANVFNTFQAGNKEIGTATWNSDVEILGGPYYQGGRDYYQIRQGSLTGYILGQDLIFAPSVPGQGGALFSDLMDMPAYSMNGHELEDAGVFI